ncbi:homeobox knotted-1-like protein [Corchorus capsularis]|uniref:Homeobox knotted-1-like protein n=1 Tax=Corchorus capsularis TaxID=210143 RepID=A0A1R3JYQ6_COCAP|nr:homeobox knotted-1-like protein [Corchorus capsularis]
MDQAKRNSTIEEIIKEEQEDEEEEIKTKISAHPLYERLVVNHLNCLKVGGIGDSGRNGEANIQSKHDYINIPCSSMLNQSELDLFMQKPGPNPARPMSKPEGLPGYTPKPEGLPGKWEGFGIFGPDKQTLDKEIGPN